MILQHCNTVACYKYLALTNQQSVTKMKPLSISLTEICDKCLPLSNHLHKTNTYPLPINITEMSARPGRCICLINTKCLLSHFSSLGVSIYLIIYPCGAWGEPIRIWIQPSSIILQTQTKHLMCF